MTVTGIILYDAVEELDFAGPFEVMAVARMWRPQDQVLTIAKNRDVIQGARGLQLLPHCDYSSAPALDILLVPGGRGSRVEQGNEATLAFVQTQARNAQWVSSVCSGALVLAGAGLLAGRRATTHWAVYDELRQYKDVMVQEGPSYVRDGNLVTSAGITAGIDMALWLLGQVADVDTVRKVQNYLDYQPAPPYQADV